MKNTVKNLISLLSVVLISSVLLSCSDDDKSTVLPMLSMPTEGADTPIAVTCDEALTGVSHTFKINLDLPATVYAMGDLRVDESLVASYNKAHGTDYELLPSNIYTISKPTVIIKAGDTESNDLAVNFTGTLYGLKKDTKYLLPIVMDLDETIASDFGQNIVAHYLCLDVDRELIYTPGLSMRTYSSAMYRTLNLPNDEVVTMDGNTHTFEMRVFNYSWHSGTNYIGTWRGKDTSNNNENFSGCELRVTGATGASNIGNRQCDLTLATQNKLIASGKWQLITITCDGTQTGQNTEIAYRLYIDGELISEAKPTKRWGTGSSQKFQVGYTLTGIQLGNTSSSYYFDGLIGEIRMWKSCLTQDEIRANLRTVSNPSSENMYGYWKVNEESGTTLKDYSGNNRDLNFPTGTNVIWSAELEQ